MKNEATEGGEIGSQILSSELSANHTPLSSLHVPGGLDLFLAIFILPPFSDPPLFLSASIISFKVEDEDVTTFSVNSFVATWQRCAFRNVGLELVVISDFRLCFGFIQHLDLGRL